MNETRSELLDRGLAMTFLKHRMRTLEFTLRTHTYQGLARAFAQWKATGLINPLAPHDALIQLAAQFYELERAVHLLEFATKAQAFRCLQQSSLPDQVQNEDNSREDRKEEECIQRVNTLRNTVQALTVRSLQLEEEEAQYIHQIHTLNASMPEAKPRSYTPSAAIQRLTAENARLERQLACMESSVQTMTAELSHMLARVQLARQAQQAVN